MSDADRLESAFAASAPPARDNAFVLAVLERAEEARFRRAAVKSALRGAGLTAAAIAALTMLAGWAQAQPEAATEGALWVAALFTMVGAAHITAQRLRAR